jgi:hypothetical protein
LEQATQLSDLETATSYLLSRQPRSALHRHRSHSLNDLAEALVVRFWHAGQPRKNGLEAVTDASNESQLLVRLLPNRLHSDYEPVNIPGWSGRSTT